jgi:poly(glycerol-phosphate) alpha-glucosyltransferase
MTLPLTGLRIGLLTASASRLGGGVFEAVVAQAGMIAAAGGQPHVFALADRHSAEDAARFGQVPVTTVPVRGPRQVGFAPGLLPALHGAGLDCLHLHGIWMYPSAAGAQWAGLTGRPYFVSPHGMLDPWITARGRWKKAIARRVYERRSWARATALHALTGREAGDIAAESGRGDSLVIPNAGPAPAGAVPPLPSPAMVYIGRIHPKKNLVALVEGWLAAARPPEATLSIAGWGESDHVAALEAAVAAADGSVRFVGPVYDAAKQAMLASARCIVLPSHSEGLPMAVLEAWAAGVPTLMTAECNLPEGFAAGAALECGPAPGQIARGIEQVLALDAPGWQVRSAAALSLARERFSAAAVAAAWARVYAGAVTANREGAQPG